MMPNFEAPGGGGGGGSNTGSGGGGGGGDGGSSGSGTSREEYNAPDYDPGFSSGEGTWDGGSDDSGGSDSDSDSSSDSDEVTTQPVTDDPVFGGGQTGSETMAEHGSPSAPSTIEGDGDSLADEVQEHGSGGVQDQIEDIAQTGDDANDETSFEQDGEEVVVDNDPGTVGGGDTSTPDNTDQNQSGSGDSPLSGLPVDPKVAVGVLVVVAGLVAMEG